MVSSLHHFKGPAYITVYRDPKSIGQSRSIVSSLPTSEKNLFFFLMRKVIVTQIFVNAQLCYQGHQFESQQFNSTDRICVPRARSHLWIEGCRMEGDAVAMTLNEIPV